MIPTAVFRWRREAHTSTKPAVLEQWWKNGNEFHAEHYGVKGEWRPVRAVSLEQWEDGDAPNEKLFED